MREIAEKRTLHSKTHDLENGQHRLTASMIPMHYEDNGQLLDIDMTIQNGVVNSGLYKVELMTDKIGFRAIDRGSGKKISVSLGKIGNDSINYSTPTIDEHKAIWPSIKPGVDIEFWFNPHQVNIFRVLQNATAEKYAEWIVEEEIGEKTIRMNDKVRGRDAAKNETKHTVVIAPPEQNEQRKSYVIRDTFDDRVFKRNPQTRVKEESADISYPVRIDPTVDVSVSNTADDGYVRRRRLNGVTTLTAFRTSTTSDFVRRETTSVTISGLPAGTRENEQKSFYRFLGITIPQSATINSANLKLYIISSSNNPPDRIEAKKLNNPAAPTTFSQAFSPATLASNVVNKVFSTAAPAVSSISITTIAQELVNAFDYSNEAMLFFVRQPSIGNGNISFEDFSFPSGTHPAQLVIDYTAGASSAIKTWNGLADASVKTVNGLARASVKTRNGLA